MGDIDNRHCQTSTSFWVSQYALQLYDVQAMVAPESRGSSNVERASEELASVAGYLHDIAKSLAGGRPAALPVSERLLGCAALVALAASEIRVRVTENKVLQGCVKELDLIRKGLARLARSAEQISGQPMSLRALRTADEAAKLAAMLEQCETRKR